MANEHSIRVSAKGEFGQLQRGLKQLQGDLKGVLGEINRGARKGGVFDDTQLRALNLYRDRFKSSMDELNREFDKQNKLIDKLHEKQMRANRTERGDIQKEIDLREKNLDVIRRQLFEVEKLYSKRNKEANSYGSPIPSSASSGGGSGMNGMLGGLLSGGKGILGKLAGFGKLGLGLAGVAGVGSMINQAYQGAYQAQTLPLDLAQRIRGQGGWNGGAYDMWNRGYGIGTANKMGYTAEESWQFQDMYSRQAGTLNGKDMGHLLKFGRAFGLSTSEVASEVGGMRNMGGASSASAYADMIAKSVSRSGMTPRILEVMETSKALLAQMNTTLKDNGAKQILAYQTTLDTIGMKNGMMGLTGKNGANIISGLGGIYDPQATDWKYMGMQALQRYNPKKYGKMGLYGLERSYEDGLLNTDNLPAMAGYLREKSGGNTSVMKRMLQKWLQAGGYNATKRQVDELYTATDGLHSFDKGKMEKVQKELTAGDGTQAYQTRMTELGQQILDTNARFEKQLEELGQPMLAMITSMKEDITKMLEWTTDNKGIQATLEAIFKFLGDNWKTLATVGSIVALGSLFGGVGSLVLRALGGLPMAIGLAVGGAFLLSNRAKDMKAEEIKNIKKRFKDNYGMDEKTLLSEMNKHGFTWDRLQAGVADPEVGAWLGEWNTKLQKKSGVLDKNGKKRTNKEWADWANEQDTKGMTKEERDAIQKHLKGLKDAGELNLSELNDNGSTDLSKLMKEGISNFEDLLKGGNTNFSKLYSDGSTYLKGVFNEHKGFKDFFAGLWKDFENLVSSSPLIGGGIPGAGGGSFGGGGIGSGYNVTSMSGVTASQLDSKLKGKLKGWGHEFVSVGKLFGIDPAVLASIAMHETGNGTSRAVREGNNVGGIMGKNGLKSYSNMETGIYELGRILKKVYVDQGLTTIEQIQKKYAPVGAKNDPNGLNKDWINGVTGFLNGFGVSSSSYGSLPTGGKSFWNGWQNRITSRFGSNEGFRKSPHKGLDIDGNQGDYLDALAGGTVSKVFYDDGGKYDKDGKKNSTAGGSTVVVKMPDGTSYAYAHLSKINSKLKVGQKIGKGTYIGNMGGTPGVAGSGYSSTGSHLHLGYYDKGMNAIDPMTLMKKLSGGGAGDLDISQVMGSGGGSSKTVNVNVKLTGEVEKLNGKTEASLKKLITQTIKDYMEHQRLVNPTTR